MSAQDDTTNNGDLEPKIIRKVKEKVSLARQFHTIAEDPYLKIVNLDRQRTRTIGCIWFFLIVGLAFTTSGVHSFLAMGLTMDDPLWWGAWAVEPMLAGLLITLLQWETVMHHRGIEIASGWVKLTKFLLLVATFAMNVTAGAAKGGAFLALHALVPLLVFCIAEVLPIVSERFQIAREKLLADISQENKSSSQQTPTTVEKSTPTPTPATVDKTEYVPTPAPAPAPAPAKPKTNGHTVKLPASMEATLAAKAQELADTGEQLTGDHVREVVKINSAMADAVASRLAAQAA